MFTKLFNQALDEACFQFKMEMGESWILVDWADSGVLYGWTVWPSGEVVETIAKFKNNK